MYLAAKLAIVCCFAAVLGLSLGCKEQEKKPNDDHQQMVGAGLCSDTSSVCTTGATGNTCTSSPCMVYFTRSNTDAVMAVNRASNGPQDYVCISPGSSIQFNTPTNNGQFVADFGTTSPFSSWHTYSTGTNSSADQQTASQPHCYKFLLRACEYVSSGSPPTTVLNCGTHDPKVIVGGGGMNAKSQK